MEKRTLGQLEVSALSLGCMGMSDFYGPADETKCIETIKSAFDMGITFFDTADIYGFGANEELVGRAIRPFRDKVILATKFGVIRKKEDPSFRAISGRPEYVKQQCESSLQRLQTDVIDLYYQHRIDPNTPIEETVHAMATLVKEGKVRYIGLSEASPEIIKRAHAVHPITAIQTEYSLWTRDPEVRILSLCKELGIGFVAYSPIGRGFLSGSLSSVDTLSPNDFRRSIPRFEKQNFEYNFRIVKVLEAMAITKGCSPAQIAIAYTMAQGDFIVPLFGTTKPSHLKENLESLKVTFSEKELDILRRFIPLGYARGDRYPEKAMRLYNFERHSS